MPYVVLFEDAPNAPDDLRSRYMSQHLDFLEANRPAVVSAGPLVAGDGEAAGGIWVVDADTPETVEALVKADPFWPTGLRKSYRILKWRQIFAGGRRQI